MIYLDNCATTKMRKEVIEEMIKSYENDFANPSSLHRLGMGTEKKIEESRKTISSYLKVRDKEVFFTSGGTESNNIAIFSSVEKMKNRGNHIITTKIEHPSVYNCMKKLENDGYNVDYLDVDEYGNIDFNQFKNLINDKTILVSIIHVNNEIGVVQDIKKIRSIMDEKDSIALLHLDGVQSFGKIPYSVKDLGINTLSISSHKIHGPKGIGALYVKDGTNLMPHIYGGGQENGFRSGTENIQGIVGFGRAVKIINDNFDVEYNHVLKIREYFYNKIKNNISDIKVNTKIDNTSSPYIINVSIRNTRGEVLLHYLEDENIYISTSSACSSNGTSRSHVLESIKLTDNEIEGTIRICFSHETTFDDIDIVVEQMKKSVKEIRDIMMR
ncbi:MAG TPA: cysteine desulfurase family protein [Tissierellaceae bacterium]